MKYSPSREAQKDLWAAHDGLIDGLTQSKPGRNNYWRGKAHRARLIDTGEYIKTSEQPRFTLTWKTVGEAGPELSPLRGGGVLHHHPTISLACFNRHYLCSGATYTYHHGWVTCQCDCHQENS